MNSRMLFDRIEADAIHEQTAVRKFYARARRARNTLQLVLHGTQPPRTHTVSSSGG